MQLNLIRVAENPDEFWNASTRPQDAKRYRSNVDRSLAATAVALAVALSVIGGVGAQASDDTKYSDWKGQWTRGSRIPRAILAMGVSLKIAPAVRNREGFSPLRRQTRLGPTQIVFPKR
jgi:hypothetical protein